MPDLVAYVERESADPETGESGILRKEWRVRRVKDFAPEELDEAWGPDWRRYRPFAGFVLEQRYIRRGVEEPWAPHSADNTFEQALQAVDTPHVPVHPKAKKLQAEREEYAAEEKAKAEQERLREIEADEHAREKARSEEAFRRMAGSPKFKVWADRWNAYIAEHQKDPEFLERAGKDAEFMARYFMVTKAGTVPLKVRAIREFLAAYGPEAHGPAWAAVEGKG